MTWSRALALALFVALTGTLAAHHEPWRDEADAWLMARDAGVGEVFGYAGYSGTPALWYLVQMPFAKAGAGYETQRYLHLLVAVAVAGLLLFRAPFPLGLRLALAFGYFLSFEYAVIARNYSAGILLCFVALAMDRHRGRLAPLYGLVLALAANTSVHFLLFALAFALPLAWEARGDRAAARRWLGVAVAGAGIGLAVWQLWPAPDGQFTPELVPHVQIHRIRETLSQALVPHRTGFWTEVVGALAVGLTLARLRTAPRAAFVFGLAGGGLLALFVVKYVAGARHFGLFLVAIVAAWWLADGEPAASRRLLRHRVLAAGLCVVLLPSVLQAAHAWRREMRHAYSEAGDMARFIESHRLERAWIAAHSPAPASAVLAFLPRRAFWYPALGEDGSHMKWDARYAAGRTATLGEVVTRVKARRPDWRDAEEPVLLLLNVPWPDAAAEGFRLLYRTPGRQWGPPDETFHLYVPDRRQP
ncbi:MAG TPA: hypothetical protein VLK35_03725 [Methylomirabilota bacterium]|nr:hypothetical protein [Methylomirabilota bacterium]